MARVLLIDDSPVALGVMRFALEETGFEVETAQEGSAGLKLLEPFAPEVVISDLEMPDMSGIDVVRHVRARSPMTPVLILTEHGEVPLVVEAMREGAFGYMRKGLSDEALVKELRSALNHRALLERNRALEEANHRYQLELEQMVEAKTREVLELQRAQAQTEKLAALGALLAGVVHEVNNPLTVISADVKWLQAALSEEGKPADVAMLRQLVTEMEQSSQRIERLMDRLKRLSHPRAAIGACDVRKALEQVEVFCRPQLAGYAELVREVDPAVTGVAMPEDDFVSVISNLVVNGCHAVVRGRGRIRVSVTAEPSERVFIQVTDNGCGIPEEYLGKVFDPFFTTKPSGKGTGLGLSLVFQMVSAAGGRVSLESKVGEGTTVTLKLRSAQVPSLPE